MAAVDGSIVTELLSTVYSGISPYTAVDMTYCDEGYPHTNIKADLCRVLFAHTPPTYIVECGSMLGGSIAVMAIVLDSLGMSRTEIVAIDPFTGDVNMWAWEKPTRDAGAWRFLRLENGMPTIHKRFLANCAARGLHQRVLPLQCTSMVGLKLLLRLRAERRIGSLPNYIYLDSAHEPEETYLELKTAWSLLTRDGILFGDDWGWDTVRNDVIRFSRDYAAEMADPAAHPAMALQGASCMDRVLLFDGQWVLIKAV